MWRRLVFLVPGISLSAFSCFQGPWNVSAAHPSPSHFSIFSVPTALPPPYNLAPPPPLPPVVQPPQRINDGAGVDGGDATAAAAGSGGPPAVEPSGPSSAENIVVPRRQSQVNLNKFLATAPSRGTDPPAAAAGSKSSGRERCKSVTVSEIAQNVQNIDVSQAALIMMPARLRQELSTVQQQQQSYSSSYSQPLPSLASTPAPALPSRSSAQLPPAALSADSGLFAAAGGGGSGVVQQTPRLERKPSIIREAVKLQLQLQQPPAPSRLSTMGMAAAGADSGSPFRNVQNPAGVLGAGGGSGEPSLPGTVSSSLSSPSQHQQPAAAAAAAAASRYSVAVSGLSPLQMHQSMSGVLSSGPSRGSLTVSIGSPLSPGGGASPSASYPPRLGRRSEMGEAATARSQQGNRAGGRVSEAPHPTPPATAAPPILSSNGGLPLSPTGNANGYLPSAMSVRDLRRGGLVPRGSEVLAVAAMAAAAVEGDSVAGIPTPNSPSHHHHYHQQQQQQQQNQDVRLPVIGGNGTTSAMATTTATTRRVVIGGGGGEGRDRDGPPPIGGGGSGSGGGRGGLSAADMAALSEAITSYEAERRGPSQRRREVQGSLTHVLMGFRGAARLRAMAIRKVDSRIKRAVMDRRLTSDEEPGPEAAPSSSLLDGGIGAALLAPLLNKGGQQQQQQQQHVSPQAQQQQQQQGPGAGGPGGSSALPGGSNNDGSHEELLTQQQPRRSSPLGSKVLTAAADLMSEPAPLPKRAR
ncbi:hypothetical protein VOLCADRAFT_93548 [Volvox carteri f. nagariensis]|uniref:Uncharacterized protein n=1 Tax=Volvox carteri f. nagariensis TaxID=3068 RepID=D8U2E7_VOLCA|nr:uncharacterized protein VOLCADRAFT_93548 [Volvox carteri f. nagariensis]EFJ46050.1 hypothetical protein VOLCADRAFT_93548 [Volvox carteri f. nagariensis]|eukprot:XP_002952800.1 hypothetical protein VOLCADRAFT_93548 [Volvox carteri f. nagariensis]